MWGGKGGGGGGGERDAVFYLVHWGKCLSHPARERDKCSVRFEMISTLRFKHYSQLKPIVWIEQKG